MVLASLMHEQPEELPAEAHVDGGLAGVTAVCGTIQWLAQREEGNAAMWEAEKRKLRLAPNTASSLPLPSKVKH